MWEIYVGFGLAAIGIGVVAWWYWLKPKLIAFKKWRLDIEKSQTRYRCIWCKMYFVYTDRGNHLTTCPYCGQTTNISFQEPVTQYDIESADRFNSAVYEFRSADKNLPETWIKMAFELFKRGRNNEAKKCLEMVSKLPNVNDEILKMVEWYKENHEKVPHELKGDM